MKTNYKKYLIPLTSISIFTCSSAMGDSSSKKQDESPFSSNDPAEFEQWDPKDERELGLDEIWIEIDKVERLNELGQQLENAQKKNPLLFELGMIEACYLISKSDRLGGLLEEVELLDGSMLGGIFDSTNDSRLDSTGGRQQGSSHGPLVNSLAEYFALAMEQAEQMGLGRNRMGADPLVSQGNSGDSDWNNFYGLAQFYLDVESSQGGTGSRLSAAENALAQLDINLEDNETEIIRLFSKKEANGGTLSIEDNTEYLERQEKSRKIMAEQQKGEEEVEKQKAAENDEENGGDNDEDTTPNPDDPGLIDPDSSNYRLFLQLMRRTSLFRDFQMDPLAPFIMPSPDATPVPEELPEAMYDAANGNVDPWINPGEEPTTDPNQMPEPGFNPCEGGVIYPVEGDSGPVAVSPFDKPEKDPPSPFILK